MLYTKKVVENTYSIYRESEKEPNLPVGLISSVDSTSYKTSFYDEQTLSVEDLEWVFEEVKYLNHVDFYDNSNSD